MKIPTVPIDKYHPSNIKSNADYINCVSSIPPHILHFGDKKSLKGMEIFSWRGHAEPETGKVDKFIVMPYFRNTYCTMGFHTINTTKYPLPPTLLYSIREENHDSTVFMMFMVNAVPSEWLRQRDSIVLDNIILYSGGSCDILGKTLWNAPGLEVLPLNIYEVTFLTRAPNLNFTKLDWNLLVL